MKIVKVLWLTAVMVLTGVAGDTVLNTAQAEQEYISEVIVYANGRPSSGRRVTLEFVGTLLSGGFTKIILYQQ